LRHDKEPSKPSARDDEAALRFDEVIKLPGGLTIQADGVEDHARALEMVNAMKAIAGGLKPGQAREVRPAAPAQKAVDLAEAVRTWPLTLAGNTIPKALTVKRARLPVLRAGRVGAPSELLRAPT
jgi:hypothetical protein